MDDPERVAATWDEALAEDRPVLVEAITDPEIACLPPHISLEQAVNFISSIAQGDPSRMRMIKKAFRQTVDRFGNGKGGGG